MRPGFWLDIISCNGDEGHVTDSRTPVEVLWHRAAGPSSSTERKHMAIGSTLPQASPSGANPFDGCLAPPTPTTPTAQQHPTPLWATIDHYGPLWNHYGTTMEQLWTTPLWNHYETVLEPLWNRHETTMKPPGTIKEHKSNK